MYSAPHKVLVLEEVVVPAITTRIAVQWDTVWSNSTEVGRLIFVLENQRHFIEKVTFPLGLGGCIGVSQKRMVRLGETLGKRMEHVHRHIILYYARMRCVQENGINSEYQHMVLEYRAGKVGPKR